MNTKKLMIVGAVCSLISTAILLTVTYGMLLIVNTLI
jgi:hypothetical protein